MNDAYIYIDDGDEKYTANKADVYAWMDAQKVEVEEYQGTLRVAFGSDEDEASWSFFCGGVSLTEIERKRSDDEDDERNDNDDDDDEICNKAAEMWLYKPALVDGFEVIR